MHACIHYKQVASVKCCVYCGVFDLWDVGGLGFLLKELADFKITCSNSITDLILQI